MRCLKIIGPVIFCLLIAGCIRTDTVIRVNPDGSGVVEETVLFSDLLVESLQNLSKAAAYKDKDGDKDKAKADGRDYIQKMMKDAGSKINGLGPDVKFVSAIPVKIDEMRGFRVIYSFRDINALKINQNPGSRTEKAGKDNDKSGKKKELIRFTFVKGPVSTLTVHMPEAGKDKKAGNQDAGQKAKGKTDAKTAETLRAVFKDMAVKVDIEIAGTILRTNATYRDKSRLTLVDMQFGKIFENKEVFEKLNAVQPKTIEEMKGLVKGMEGLKIELNNPVVVEFR
jgi:hypothetical protein